MQPPNAWISIVVRPSGNVTSDSLVQFKNAVPPIDFTPSGILIVPNILSLQNASLSIFHKPEPNITCVSDWHPLKVLIPI